jgi:hypothetical protein
MTRLAVLPAVGLLVLLLAWASEPTAGAMGIALAQATGDMGRYLAAGIACSLMILAGGVAGALIIGVHHVTAPRYLPPMLDNAPPRRALGQSQALDVWYTVREEQEVDY